MIQDRKSAIDTISRVLAITRLDIEQHQALNDLSLNIHGENYFRDLMNDLYGCDYKNANLSKSNEPYIDLVDDKNKKVVQITTTRTKDKIKHSLKVFTDSKYHGYKITLFYLLDKAMPTTETKNEIEQEYSVNLSDILKDSHDLIKDINDLEESKLINLCQKHFASKEQKYTEQIVLDLVFRKLLKEKSSVTVSYDDDLGSVDAIEKISINKINQRVSTNVLASLDYTCIIDSLSDGEISTDLRALIVDDFYKSLLVEQLKVKKSKEQLKEMTVLELQDFAVENNVDFSKLLSLLVEKIEGHLIVRDFNCMNIAWILVSYFFEICDVGVRQGDTSE